ncbi:MAG: response regulator [Acidobacteriota bacterium]|nr:response regulator [Blastocatellia bacterium]MDW8411208.1 response regulator [Acidobacteriota bacterium]
MEFTKWVLVVDDDPIVRKLISVVAKSCNFEVVEANNGREALELLKTDYTYLPDLILVDLYMPEMDGAKYCQALRDELGYPLERVVVISSASMKKDRDLIASLGVRDFLKKPFSMTDIRKLFQI